MSYALAMQLGNLQGEHIGICVSGGLDSKTVTTRLMEAGLRVTCFCADLGQPDEEDVSDVARRMAPTGAETHLVDLRDDMAEAAFAVLRSQATYDGGYWNTTGIARAVTVRGLIGAMQKQGCTVLAHGATGRGNDQVRFERYTNVLAPDMKVYAPWRDPELLEQFPGRSEMAAYLRDKGVEAGAGAAKRYSTDANLAGLSHEAEDLESLGTPATIVEPGMGVWPHDAPDTPEHLTIRVEAGRAVEIHGERLAPLAMMERANAIGGRNGLGLKNALENRVIGTKSRGVYEAPGMALLGRALAVVYEAVLDRRTAELFGDLSRLVADQIYDGRYFEPATRAALVAIDEITRPASGSVGLALYKGHLFFENLSGCEASLYNEADSSMEASEGLNPASSQGYVEVQSVEAKAMASAGHIRSELWPRTR